MIPEHLKTPLAVTNASPEYKNKVHCTHYRHCLKTCNRTLLCVHKGHVLFFVLYFLPE